MRDGEAVIVDEFTGHVMRSPLERWTASGYRSKELQIGETPTRLRLPQNFFLLYPRLANMTGTAKTEEVEFERPINLEPIVPQTVFVPARLGRSGCRRSRQMACRCLRNRRNPQERPAGARGHNLSRKK